MDQLVRLGRAEQTDIDEILGQFDVLDADQSGSLDMQDIMQGLEKQRDAERQVEGGGGAPAPVAAPGGMFTAPP